MAAYPYIFGDVHNPFVFGQGGIGSVGPVFQPETTAYMTAVGIAADGTMSIYGITGVQLWDAVDVFIVGIKGDGITLSDLFAYPIIGGTAARHALEMFRPTGGTWDATFTASPDHVSAGVRFQLTSQNMLFPFGSAGFLPEFANTIGYYQTEVGLSGKNKLTLGSIDNLTLGGHYLFTRTGSGNVRGGAAYSNSTRSQVSGVPDLPAHMALTIRGVADIQAAANEVALAVAAGGGTQPSAQFNLGNSASAVLGSYAFVWFYKQGMTAAQMIQMQARIHALQTALNRQITY